MAETAPTDDEASPNRQPAPTDQPARPTTSVADLERWEDHGATWRMYQLTDDRVLVELCTCYGEPVDVVQSQDRAVIAFVRRHAAAGRDA